MCHACIFCPHGAAAVAVSTPTGNAFSTLYVPFIHDGRKSHTTAAAAAAAAVTPAGNDFSTLYAPLIRDGRMEKYYWNPTREDRVGVCMGIFQVGAAAAVACVLLTGMLQLGMGE
jgi:hypothetical protein